MKNVMTLLLVIISSLSAQVIELKKGWNLVGSNRENVNINASISIATAVWKYSNNNWQVTSPNGDLTSTINSSSLSTFSTVNAGEGFWVNIEQDTNVTLSGETVSSTELSLESGWNLMSLKGESDINMSEYSMSNSVQVVWKYSDNDWQAYSEDPTISNTITNSSLTPLTTLNIGDGFWVNCADETVINFNVDKDIEEIVITEDVNETIVEKEIVIVENNESTTEEIVIVEDNNVSEDVNETTVIENNSSNSVITTNVDIVDTDGDGMIDVAEIKYGFDPYDALSFPTVPEFVNVPAPTQHVLNVDAIDSIWIEETQDGIVVKWEGFASDEEVTIIKLLNDTEQLVYVAINDNELEIDYDSYNLNGDELLSLELYIDGTYDESSFVEIDLNNYEKVTVVVGEETNKISYSFKGFTSENEEMYNDFLKKVWPIMLDVLGAPAESFNCEITSMGSDVPWFMIINQGRTFLTTQEFIPRLIVHEFIHAWKGSYLISSDENWEYSTELNGFEEALAEGFAFEIIHKFVKAFPNDSATEQLLSWKPYQYHSMYSNHYDTIKTLRSNGAGEFWTYNGSHEYRYSSAATTAQIIAYEYPYFYRDTQAEFYKRVNADSNWRPTRENMIDIWSKVAPTVQGIEMSKFLAPLPVFQGKALDDGFYIQTNIRHYGEGGDFTVALTYALDGYEWWNLNVNDLDNANIPDGVPYVPHTDNWVYPDLQSQLYSYNIYSGNTLIISSLATTEEEYADDGRPMSLGFHKNDDLQQGNHELGLYRADITFDNFSEYNGSSESFYFFGYDGEEVETNIEPGQSVISVGIDTLVDVKIMTTIVNDITRTTEINNGLGRYRYESELPNGHEGFLDISISTDDKTCNYKRTMIDTSTYWGKAEFGFVIIDKDFNCVEDIYE